MSIGDAVPWVHAYEVAKELAAELEPIVARSKAVGSLRRRQPTVGDIEFLVEPRTAGTDLFGEPGAPDIEAIHRLADTWGEVTVAGGCTR